MVLSDAGSFDAHIGLNGLERALDTFGATGFSMRAIMQTDLSKYSPFCFSSVSSRANISRDILCSLLPQPAQNVINSERAKSQRFFGAKKISFLVWRRDDDA